MPIFLKFDGFDGDYTLGMLENAFLKIDANFLKLSNASLDPPLLKIEDNLQIKHDITVISDVFHKLGDDFLKVDAALKFGSFILKLTQPTVDGATLNAAATGDNNLPAVQSEFLKLGMILKTSAVNLGTLGSDFLKLNTAHRISPV